MKQFLKASGSDQMLEKLEMNNVWPLMEKDDTCPHAMLHFARCMHHFHIHVQVSLALLNMFVCLGYGWVG